MKLSLFVFVLPLMFLQGSGNSAIAQDKALKAEDLTGFEDGRLALLDRLYYRHEQWMPVLRNKISRLESLSPDLNREMELMIYRFHLAAVNVELSYTLGLTGQFRMKENEEEYRLNMEKAKEGAETILEDPNLSAHQRALAYLFLGGAVGYIGKYEFGVGNMIKAFVNGFWADTNLEKALSLDPGLVDAHIGLGMYRYVNSRMGGIGNFIMQGGQDLRQVGISHLEQAIKSNAPAKPIAYKALIMFYISEQLNGKNRDLPAGHPLSLPTCRAKTLKWIEEYESLYFKGAPEDDFMGNKELTIMKAIHYAINGEYAKAREEYENTLQIMEFLRKKKGYKINPMLARTVKAGIEYCDLMLLNLVLPDKASTCTKIGRHLSFLESGEMMIESDIAKIGEELAAFFYDRLSNFSRRLNCP